MNALPRHTGRLTSLGETNRQPYSCQPTDTAARGVGRPRGVLGAAPSNKKS